MTHYSLVAHDPKGREYLIVVLPPNDDRVPAMWKWQVGVVVHVDGGAVMPLHYWTTYAREGPDARKAAANLAFRLEEGKLLGSAEVYLPKEGTTR